MLGRWVFCPINPATQCIILKIVGFLVELCDEALRRSSETECFHKLLKTSAKWDAETESWDGGLWFGTEHKGSKILKGIYIFVLLSNNEKSNTKNRPDLSNLNFGAVSLCLFWHDFENKGTSWKEHLDETINQTFPIFCHSFFFWHKKNLSSEDIPLGWKGQNYKLPSKVYFTRYLS